VVRGVEQVLVAPQTLRLLAERQLGDPQRPVAAYATSVRRRRKSGCPMSVAGASR